MLDRITLNKYNVENKRNKITDTLLCRKNELKKKPNF